MILVSWIIFLRWLYLTFSVLYWEHFKVALNFAYDFLDFMADIFNSNWFWFLVDNFFSWLLVWFWQIDAGSQNQIFARSDSFYLVGSGADDTNNIDWSHRLAFFITHCNFWRVEAPTEKNNNKQLLFAIVIAGKQLVVFVFHGGC